MKSNHQPNTKSSPRNYITEYHIHTSLKNIWGWQFHHCTGPPLPLPNHWTAGRISSWQQSKPPPAQLETISSCSVICHVRKQTTTLFTTTSFQAITDSNDVCSQPPLCWAKQPQFPHVSFSSFFSSFIALLWMHSSSSITFSCWEAKLNAAHKVQSHHHCIQENNSLPAPADHSIWCRSCAVGLLAHLGTLRAPVQLAVTSTPGPILLLTFQPLLSRPVLLHEATKAQGQQPASKLAISKHFTVLVMFNFKWSKTIVFYDFEAKFLHLCQLLFTVYYESIGDVYLIYHW